LLPSGIDHLDILQNLYDGVYLVDPDRKITFWNHSAERITGYAEESVSGSCCGDQILMHVDDSGKCLCEDGCPLQATLDDGEVREADVYLHHHDGHRVPVRVRTAPVRAANGEIIGAVEVFSENSERLALLERITDLEQAAMIDALTGLANRRFLSDRLTVCFGEKERYGWPFGVLFLDIDDFKNVNDRYGHQVGDETLKLVARVLLNNLRQFDLAGRWGGEEFVVVTPNIDATNIQAMAERLRVLVQKSDLRVAPHVVQVTVSIGATLPRPQDTIDSLIERADNLMYRSKDAGRNQVFFEE